MPGACSISSLRDVDAVEAGSAVRYDVGAESQSCFRGDGGAYIVSLAVGDGQVVAVGGATFLTNDLLDERDNAVLAAALLAPGPSSRIRFVDAPLPAGGGDKSLGDLVADGVTRGLLQLGFAFVLYALWRAIRHGQPVVEGQPVDLAGSELRRRSGAAPRPNPLPGHGGRDAPRRRARRALRARIGAPLRACRGAGHDHRRPERDVRASGARRHRRATCHERCRACWPWPEPWHPCMRRSCDERARQRG